MLQKLRPPQIQGGEAEAIVCYCEPSATQEMQCHRLSRRLNNMAVFSPILDVTAGGFVNEAL